MDAELSMADDHSTASGTSSLSATIAQASAVHGAVLMEGPLKQRGAGIPVMRDRYCVATWAVDTSTRMKYVLLRSYKKRKDYELHPEKPASEDMLKCISEWDGKGKFHQYDYAFVVETRANKLLHCSAPSDTEKVRWMALISANQPLPASFSLRPLQNLDSRSNSAIKHKVVFQGQSDDEEDEEDAEHDDEDEDQEVTDSEERSHDSLFRSVSESESPLGSVRNGVAEPSDWGIYGESSASTNHVSKYDFVEDAPVLLLDKELLDSSADKVALASDAFLFEENGISRFGAVVVKNASDNGDEFNPDDFVDEELEARLERERSEKLMRKRVQKLESNRDLYAEMAAARLHDMRKDARQPRKSFFRASHNSFSTSDYFGSEEGDQSQVSSSNYGDEQRSDVRRRQDTDVSRVTDEPLLFDDLSIHTDDQEVYDVDRRKNAKKKKKQRQSEARNSISSDTVSMEEQSLVVVTEQTSNSDDGEEDTTDATEIPTSHRRRSKTKKEANYEGDAAEVVDNSEFGPRKSSLKRTTDHDDDEATEEAIPTSSRRKSKPAHGSNDHDHTSEVVNVSRSSRRKSKAEREAIRSNEQLEIPSPSIEENEIDEEEKARKEEEQRAAKLKRKEERRRKREKLRRQEEEEAAAAAAAELTRRHLETMRLQEEEKAKMERRREKRERREQREREKAKLEKEKRRKAKAEAERLRLLIEQQKAEQEQRELEKKEKRKKKRHDKAYTTPAERIHRREMEEEAKASEMSNALVVVENVPPAAPPTISSPVVVSPPTIADETAPAEFIQQPKSAPAAISASIESISTPVLAPVSNTSEHLAVNAVPPAPQSLPMYTPMQQPVQYFQPYPGFPQSAPSYAPYGAYPTYLPQPVYTPPPYSNGMYAMPPPPPFYAPQAGYIPGMPQMQPPFQPPSFSTNTVEDEPPVFGPQLLSPKAHQAASATPEEHSTQMVAGPSPPPPKSVATSSTTSVLPDLPDLPDVIEF